MKNSYKNRLHNALLALRGVETTKPTSRQIPSITPEEVKEVRAVFAMEKFFIFGHARSGTTMLARLIRLHPEVHCNYQAHFFTRQPLLESLVASAEVGEWLSRRSNRWNRGKDLSPVVLRVVADYILERDAKQEGKHIVGDKSPNSLLNGDAVRLLQKVYPDAHLIYIVRDGRDAAISHRFQSFIEFPERLSKEDQHIRAEFIKDPNPFLLGGRSIFTPAALRRAIDGWVRNLSETDMLGRQLFNERYLSLRYEDLLQKPWEQIRRVWDFLGAFVDQDGLKESVHQEMTQNPDAAWQKEKAIEIAEPLQKGKHGGWREILTHDDQRIFTQLAGPQLAAWGYPLDAEFHPDTGQPNSFQGVS